MPMSTATSKWKKHSSGRNTGAKRLKNPLALSAFGGVVSEEDEIHLLKAFLEIIETSKNSSSPATTAASLLKSLSHEANMTQLIKKLRGLREKYKAQLHNKPSIKTPHEQEVFEISHKIWCNSRGSSKKPQLVNFTVKEESKTLADTSRNENGRVEDEEVKLGEKHSVLIEEMSWSAGKAFLMKGLQCLEESQLDYLNEQWRLQMIAEAEVSAMKFELFQMQTNLILNAIISPSPGPA